VFSVLVDAGMIGVAVLGALLSTVALAYYLRVIVVLYMQDPPEEYEPPSARRTAIGVVGAVCALFVLAMGLFPALFLGLIGR
jgi:NADH-quinone oxidoreductase subunit N